MARTVSDELKEIIYGSSGKPIGVVNLYATNFPYHSDGMLAEYFNVISNGSTYISKEDRPVGRQSIDKYSDGTYIHGIPLTDYNGDIYSFPENQISFNWGLSPPMGINPYDLKDQRRWGVRWTGYFYFDEPGVYQFGFVSTSLAQITVGGQILASGISSNKILSGLDPTDASQNRTIRIQETGFLPIVISFVKRGTDKTKERDQDNERFTAFWKSTEEDDWKIIDSSRVVQNYTIKPLSGDLIEKIEIDISENTNIGSSTSAINPDNFPVEIKLSGGYLLKDGAVWLKDLSPIVTSDLGSSMRIYLSDNRTDGSRAEIYSPDFLDPLVSTNGLPRVVEITENHSSRSASTTTFTVDVTNEEFDPENVNANNCYTYYANTESFGVLRKGRLVDIELGYRTNVNEGAIQRFRGHLHKINVVHGSDGSNRLKVECIDLSKHINDVQNKELPDLISYDSANLFEPTPDVDGDIRPRTYDGWRLVDVIRDLAYKAGITSEQLYAKDSNGNYLVEDASDRLMKGLTYPFETKTVPGGELSSPYLFLVNYGENLWNKMQEVAESFGRRLYFNMDGNLVLSRPNNPKVLANYWTDSSKGVDNTDPDWIEAPNIAKYNSLRSIRGFFYNVDSSFGIRVNFQGVGIAAIVIRTVRDAHMRAWLGKRRSSADPDASGIQLIDGSNVLDTDTEHTGSIEYTALLDEDGYYPLKLSLLGDQVVFEDSNVWHYKYGNHPRLGYNPSIIRICDNLTYGNYQLVITPDRAVGIEGFLIFKSNVYGTVRTFSGETGNLSVTVDDDEESMRNSVTVIGATIGGGDLVEVTNKAETSVSRVNNTIIAKAIDIGSVKNPELPNYVGREKPITIINPAIRDQNRAEFLAQYVLRRYKRNQRNPSVTVTGSPELELFDCITIDDAPVGLETPVAIENSGRPNIFRENPDPLNRFWINSIQSSINATGEYTSTIQATPLEPQPSYEPLPDPPEEQFSGRKFFDNLTVSIDGSISSVYYNAYEEDATGKYVKIEFDQIFNARRLWVKVKAAESFDYKERELTNDYTTQTLVANQDIYTLAYQEGFIPHQHHTLYWNGWWADENSGGSQGGGKYVPNGAKVYIEIYMEKYSNGRAGTVTSLDTSSINKGLTTITMQNSSTGFYTGNTLSVTYEPETLSGGTVNSIYPYVFDDSDSNYYGSIKTIVKTNRPGGLYIALAVYNITYFGVSSDVNNWTLRTVEKYIYPVTGTATEVDVRDKGERVFYINPNNLVIGGDKSAVGITSNLNNLDKIVAQHARIKARDLIRSFKKDMPISSGIKLYYEYFTRPTGMSPTDSIFKLWLIRIPGSGQPDSEQVGFALFDKDMNVFTYSATDRWVVWQTSETLYPKSTLTSDSFVDKLSGDKGNLTITLSNIEVQKTQ